MTSLNNCWQCHDVNMATDMSRNHIEETSEVLKNGIVTFISSVIKEYSEKYGTAYANKLKKTIIQKIQMESENEEKKGRINSNCFLTGSNNIINEEICAIPGEMYIKINFAHDKQPEFIKKYISLNEGDEPTIVGWVDKNSGMVCINPIKPQSEHKPRNITKLRLLGIWNNKKQNIIYIEDEIVILHAKKFGILKAELSEEISD